MGLRSLNVHTIKPLFHFLGVPLLANKRWSNIEWVVYGIFHVYSNEIQNKINVSSSFQYLTLTCDKVTTIGIQSWVSIHAYIVKDWTWSSILISFNRVTKGKNANNLTKVTMDVLKYEGSVSKSEIAFKISHVNYNY
jgi:hypothetical protein